MQYHATEYRTGLSHVAALDEDHVTSLPANFSKCLTYFYDRLIQRDIQKFTYRFVRSAAPNYFCFQYDFQYLPDLLISLIALQ